MSDEPRLNFMKHQPVFFPKFNFDLHVPQDELPPYPTARRIALALRHHQLAKTCFCPAGGYGGGEELANVSHYCSTYIYADLWADSVASVETLRDFFEDIENQPEQGDELHFVRARELSVGSIFREMEAEMCAFMEQHFPNDAGAYREAVEPLAEIDRWGIEVVLNYGISEVEKEIRVLCYHAEPLAFYRGVYAAAGVAPRAVVVPNLREQRPVDLRHLSLDGPLGGLLCAGPSPSMLLVPRWQVGLLAGTPWSHVWFETEKCVWATLPSGPFCRPLPDE